jgi:hypothetical protein
MTCLLALILFHPFPLLVGYWYGAAMHLTFDVLVNGEYALKRVILFYVFAYRASKRFAAEHLVDRIVLPEKPVNGPIRDFFRWKPAFTEQLKNRRKKAQKAQKVYSTDTLL